MKVIWTLDAELDRHEIYHYIAADNPHAAGRMNILFDKAADRLTVFPEQGKPGAIPGTRELYPHQNYRLVYEVDEVADIIWIQALVHGAQQSPPPPPE